MMTWFLDLPQTSPAAHALILLSLVCAAGMGVGSIKIRGVGLGSSGVLFVGILMAHWMTPIDARTLNFIRDLGLVLFVFTMGLQLGPGFFASLRADGWRLNLLAAVLVLSAGVLAPLLGWLAGMEGAAIAGLFAGASINMPALGAAQQALAGLPTASPSSLALPALACAVSYPAAVLSSLAVLAGLRAMFGIDPRAEAAQYAADRQAPRSPLIRRSFVVEKDQFVGRTVDEAHALFGDGIVISRIRPVGTGEVHTALHGIRLQRGDTILAVGTERLLEQFERMVGPRSNEDLLHASGQISFRRYFVTRSEVLGKTTTELDLEGRFGVRVTRILRGDVEMTAVPSLRLQFGDVLQVVGTEEQLSQAAGLLGNSLRKLNQTQFVPLFAGISLGVLAGSMPLAIPGLTNPVRLGLAGGPLLLALLLGRLGHVRGLIWHMPLNANHAFREFGLALFFAGLGLGSGNQFFSILMSWQGITWLMVGLLVTVLPLLGVGIWARAVWKMDFVTLGGLLAGGSTNPPALSFVSELCGTESPALAYATVFPLTTLLRTLVAQSLVMLCTS